MVVVVGRVWKIMLDRGYGFISTEPPSEDVFFHASVLIGVRMVELREGDSVQFTLTRHDGKYRAKDVRRIESGGRNANSLGES